MKKLLFSIYLILAFSFNLYSQTSEKKNCYAGAYVNDISSVDAKNGFAIMNFEVWVKWEGDVMDCPKIIINNIYEETILELETIHDDETNWNLKKFNVRGNITCQWNVQFYPFDHHKLNINIMLDDNSYDKWELKPALSNSGLSNVNTVTDWEVYPTLMVGYDTIRNKNITLDQSKDIPKKEMVIFYVEIKRPLLPQFTKIIGPLILITLIGLLALAIPINELEVRTAFAFTALLSIVAYQFTTSDSTPDVSYLTIMDYVFIYGYIFVGASLFIVWWCSIIPEERGVVISKIAFRFFIPCYLILNSFIIISKYVESITGIPQKEAQYSNTRYLDRSDTLRINNFRERTLFNLIPFWLPNLSESKGENDVNIIIPQYPSFKDNSVHLLSDGKMEVFWTIYSNLQWSDGFMLSSEDIEFGFKIEPDSMLHSIELLRRDLIKLTYKENIFQPQQRNLPIYPLHFYKNMLQNHGKDSVIKHRKFLPSPGYGPYYVVSKDNHQIHFKYNPYCPNNTSQFKNILIEIVPYDTTIINKGKADLYFKNAILPEHFMAHLNDTNSSYANKIDVSQDNISLVSSFDVTNGNQAALSNALSKFFNRKEFINKFFGSSQLSVPVYWPVSKNTKFYDSTCLHCDEFDLPAIKEILKQNEFVYKNNALYNNKGEPVVLNFFRMDKNRVPRNVNIMNDYVFAKLESLGIQVTVNSILLPAERFKTVSNAPGFSVYLEYGMNEEILMNWTFNLKSKDQLMEKLYRKFDREVIEDLRALLGKRMINYQTTQTHVFVPICSLTPRNTYKKELAKKFILPFCTIENLHIYTNY